MLGAQVISRVREAFGVDVPLRVLFASLTVRALAGVVDDLVALPRDGPGPALVPVDRPDRVPLTFAQEGLWFLDQLAPHNPAYVLPAAYRITGPLDVGALRRALDRVVARHEPLRTTFPAEGGRPFQLVASTVATGIEVHDLVALGPDQAESEARRLAGRASSTPFDLARGPLLRAHLAVVGAEHHVLVLTVHHIVSDGWSVNVLVSDLARAYDALVEGREPALAGLAVQYADYAIWQRKALEGGPLLDRLAHWRARLAGAPLVLDLPTDRPRPATPSYRGASVHFSVPAATAHRLAELGRGRGATPFVVLLTAFEAVLARTTGSDDLVVGTPVAGRDRIELEPLVGYFVTTLPLRTDLSGDPPFSEAVDRVRDTTLDAFDHRDLPFDRLVADLAPVRDPGRNPVVQVMFQMAVPPGGPERLGRAVMEDLGGIGGADYGEAGGTGPASPFDLDVSLSPVPGGGLDGVVVYATDLFERATVARMVDRFLSVLDSAASDPGAPLSRLTGPPPPSYRPPAGQDLPQPPSPDPAPASVAQLVAARAARCPGATAVVAGERSLTYAELVERAHRLAHHLRSLGVGPDRTVGVCLERGPDLAVSLLAVLAAGGACVPLDPSYPAERLELMAADAGLEVVVTTTALAPAVGRVPRVVRVDADAGQWATRPATAPAPVGGPDDVAYVIYTSGSTGVPKGVALTHRGLVGHHLAAVDLFGLGPGDRVLQFCSLGFDASIEEMFPTWAAGATVVFRPEDSPLLGRSWLGWLEDQRITVVDLPTAYWHAWVRDLEELGAEVPPAIRLVVVGGERARGPAYRSWARLAGGRSRWVNTYGPTETSIVVTAHEMGPDDDDGADPPIGRAVAGAVLEVLDAWGDPVAPGATGELVVGGPGLARGYLNQPELTAERFEADPAHPGRRRYRTGDLVRQRPDGVLEYVGRSDRQVKVRGFRVECGEVEAALLSHPGVAEAVVVGRHQGDQTRLVAYVVPAGPAPGAGVLRRHLAGRLPDHMVPGAFSVLDRMPLTVDGKVDHDRLPDPDPWGGPNRPRTAPGSDTETRVAAIWSRVLDRRVEEVGVHDDFFELGGHSLLATQVIARVREEFGTRTPLRAIFEFPTVAGLASAVDAEGPSAGGPPPLAAGPRRPGEWMPLSLAQEQMWALEAGADPPGLYNVTALQWFDGDVDVPALRRALAVLAERHEPLRTSVRLRQGRPAQRVEDGVEIPLGVTDLRSRPAAEREPELERAIAELDGLPFELAHPPLLRAHLFVVGDGSARLVTTFDHLVCDGTSAFVFLTELEEAYRALARGAAPDLAPLEVHFGDFVAWQRRHVTEDVLAAQLDWWARALAGAPLGPAVPFDRVPDRPSRRIARQALSVDAAVRGLLDGRAREAGATVFMVCAAATQALLARWSETTDVVVSTTLSGRSRAELDGLVGMFSGIGRLRAELSGDPPFHEVLRRTRDMVVGLFDNQDVPFMRVRRALFPDFPTSGIELAAALPTELQYFHTSPGSRAQGQGVVERPGPGRNDKELYFRGQLHPLSITLLDDGRQLWGDLSYKVDFYDRATTEGLAASLTRVLAAVAADPTLRLSELPVGPGRAGGGPAGPGRAQPASS